MNSLLKKSSALEKICHRGMTCVDGMTCSLSIGVIFVKYKGCLIRSFKVLNFGNCFTLIFINTIYFDNIFPLSFKDNHILRCTYIYSFIFDFWILYTVRCENNLHVSKELFRLLFLIFLIHKAAKHQNSSLLLFAVV
jgi:hypothetical protein